LLPNALQVAHPISIRKEATRLVAYQFPLWELVFPLYVERPSPKVILSPNLYRYFPWHSFPVFPEGQANPFQQLSSQGFRQKYITSILLSTIE